MYRLVILCAAISLTGCGSAQKVVAEKPQYCYTSQTIKSQNKETVNSETTVECTDDRAKQLSTVRMGMASNCGTFTYTMNLGGKNVQRQGISCQKLDGSWEIVGAYN
jgi:hypothetical protein